MRAKNKSTLLWAAVFCVAGLHIYTALTLPVGRIESETIQLVLARNPTWVIFSYPESMGASRRPPLPVFSLLWSIPAWFFGTQWILYRMASLAVSWLSLWAVWRLAHRLLLPVPAAWATLLTALHPMFVAQAGAVLPEIPLLGLSSALLFRFIKGGKTAIRTGSFAYGTAIACLYLSLPGASERTLLAGLGVFFILVCGVISALAAKIPRVRPKTVTSVLAAILLSMFLKENIRAVSYRPPRLGSISEGTMEWIRRETNPSARFESSRAFDVVLLGGRWAAFPPAGVNDARTWLKRARANKIDYVHFASRESLERRRWAEASPHLRQVYFDRTEETRIYRIRHESEGRPAARGAPEMTKSALYSR